jgi:hypothetical protein
MVYGPDRGKKPPRGETALGHEFQVLMTDTNQHQDQNEANLGLDNIN